MRTRSIILVVAAVLLVLVAAGCGGSSTETTTAVTETPAGGTVGTTPGTTPGTSSGVGGAPALFATNCASCHGPTGEGGAGLPGPNLVQLGPTLTEDVIKTTIENGRGQMPPFKDRLSGDEIDELAEYVNKGLKGD